MIKGKAEPESRRALPLEVWLERPGRPKGLYFGKLFSMDGTGEGDLEFRLPAPYGRCKGRWKFRVGADATASLLELGWKVDCANGQKAVGNYRASESGRGEGEGRMTDGARLSLELGS